MQINNSASPEKQGIFRRLFNRLGPRTTFIVLGASLMVGGAALVFIIAGAAGHNLAFTAQFSSAGSCPPGFRQDIFGRCIPIRPTPPPAPSPVPVQPPAPVPPSGENQLPYGQVVNIQNGVVSGWAYDPDLGSTPVEVHIYIDGAFSGITSANLSSPNLEPNVVSANHGYTYSVPSSVSAGQHQVNVYAINTPTGYNPPLSGSPYQFIFSPVVPDRSPVGFVDAINCNLVSGWAYDPDSVDQSVMVHVYKDAPGPTNYVGSFNADQSRPDVNSAYGITGKHGFTFPLPAVFKDGQSHTVHMYAINTNSQGQNPEVRNSGGAVRCSVGQAQAKLYGLQSSIQWAADTHTTAERIAKMKELGVNSVRITAHWDHIEHVKGQYNWDGGWFDTLVQQLTQAGIKPVVIIYGSPSWANGVDPSVDVSYGAYVPTDPAKFNQWVGDYAQFARQLVLRYKDKVQYWELWNEPNLKEFWKPTPNVTSYAVWSHAIGQTIKQVDSQAKVAYGSLTILDGYSLALPGEIKGVDFLNSLYDVGLFPDIVSIHPYALTDVPPDQHSAGDGISTFRDVETIKAIMDQRRPGNNQIWITEYGWRIGAGAVTSEQIQAQYMQRSLEIIRDSWPYVTMAIWHLDYYPDQFWTNYALIRNDFSIRPAGVVFRNFVTSP